MKNTTMLALVLTLIVVIGVVVFATSTKTNPSTSEETSTESAQKIVLSLKNYNYYPNTITVKVNQPVQISLDKSVSGCLRSFTVPEFGVAKVLKTPDDFVEFTPTKKGTFRFQCSMGMGYGTLVVE